MREKIRAYVRSLRFRIVAIVVVCGLLPITVLGTYIGMFFLAPIKTRTLADVAQGAQSAQARVMQRVESAIKEAKMVTYDGTLERAVRAQEEGELSYQTFYRNCKFYLDIQYLRSTFFQYGVFYSFSHPAQLIYSTAGDQHMSAFTAQVFPTILEMAKQMDTRSMFLYGDGQMFLVRKLHNLQLKPFGLLVLAVKFDSLFLPFYEGKPMWEDRVDIRLDQFERYATRLSEPIPDQGVWENGVSEQEQTFCYQGEANTRDYSLRFRLHIDSEAVYAQIRNFIMVLALLVVLLLFVMLGTMWFIHRQFSIPVRRLADAAERIETGDLGTTVPVAGRQDDELGKLSQSFNQMSLQIKYLVEHAYKEELMLRDARIQALQSRINPHFMNNTLEIMNWQARMEGSETISRMIDALGVLLDATMDRSDRRLVPLREELELADAYLYFITLRYGDKLTVSREIDQALLAHTVPRLVIQTLLENAIQHGIAPEGGGCVAIKVYRQAEQMRIEVINDGKRLSQVDQIRIQTLLAAPAEDPHSEHLGIRNVHQRLRLIYSADAGLTLTQDENGDTMARIAIPLTQAKENSTTIDNE